MKKVILLVRVSTIYQSNEAQRTELIDFVKRDNYSDNEMIIIEDKESATKLSDEERQGLVKMYEAIKDHTGIECVYAWEISRISRKPITLHKIKEYLVEKKINLKTKHENFKLLDSNGQLDTNSNTLLGIYISMCENEIVQRLDRTRRGKMKSAMEGKFTGGLIMYGYSYDEKTKEYKVNDEQAAIIKHVFSLYETGKYGLNTLYKEMLKRTGSNFTIQQLNRILNSHEYIGGVRPEYTVVQKRKQAVRTIQRYSRYYPQIISEEQFNICRTVADQNNNNIDKSKNIYYAHKLIKCSSCGGYLVGSKCIKQYRCPKKYSLSTKVECDDSDRININVIDSLLCYLAADKEASFIVNRSEEKINEYQNNIADLKEKIGSIDKRRVLLKEEKIKQLRKEIPVEAMNDTELEGIAKKSIVDSVRELEREKVSYEEQITKFERLIAETNSNLNEKNLSHIISTFEKALQEKEIYEGKEITLFEKLVAQRSYRFGLFYKDGYVLSDFLNKFKNDMLTAKIAANLYETTTDEKEIYDLVHKHVREVSIKKVEDIFKPGKYTKQITVKYFEGDNDIYFYDGQTRVTEKNIYQIKTLRQITGKMEDDNEEPIRHSGLPKDFLKNRFGRK
jgi:DNA invertase Pin-like site-specific DNA recombinase